MEIRGGEEMFKSVWSVEVALAAAALVGLVSPAHAQQSGEVVSRFSSIAPNDCTATGDGSAEDQDWVSYRCEGHGGMAVYLFFSDGVRLSLGFGDSSAPFMGYPADRGRVINGRFVPHAAIARMKTHPEDETVTWSSELVVFGLSGQPCVLGEVHGAHANERARQLADTGRC
jgi:hypothetical protein